MIDRRSTRIAAALVATLALLAVAPAGAAAKRTVPRGFWGANWDGELKESASQSTQDQSWSQMAADGVETQRTSFRWSIAQPSKDTPIDYSASDALVTLAASHGIALLPIVFQAPAWARRSDSVNAPPKDPKAYGEYLRQLIERYGPNGRFWKLNPTLHPRPIRVWQIWNEPSANYQWSVQPGTDWASGYSKLLKVAYRAVKKADPGARVVLAGLPNRSYQDLKHLYKVGHIHGYFDVAALHPYTATKGGVLTIAKRFKAVMQKNGDGNKQLWITELGLPASKGQTSDSSSLQTDDAGMARFLRQAYKDLTANRKKLRVTRVFWYTWASSYQGWIFNWTGLLRYSKTGGQETLDPKPALHSYTKLALKAEGKPPAGP
jgi:Glycosyl hydrolase catalytic core